MKQSRKFILVYFFLLSSSLTLAQKRQIVLANKSMAQMDYVESIAYFKKASEKGHAYTARELENLAHMHYSLAQYKESANYFNELIQKGVKTTLTYYKEYIHALTVLDNKVGLIEVLQIAKDHYPEVVFEQTNSNKLIEGFKFKDTIAGYILLRQVNQNLYGVDVQDKTDKISLLGVKGSVGVFEEATYNQGSISSSKSGDTLYVTANLHKGNKTIFVNDRYSPLQIYQYTKKDGLWINENRLSINSDRYSTSSPALSLDGKTLYFVSDQPSSIGETDIYKSVLSENGLWGKAENLGPRINTAGKESHVFVNEQNIMFFSSDGHGGQQGLDVYAIDLNKPDSEIYRLDAPVNSAFDDFGYFSSGLLGYVSSNRSSTLASYAFTMDKPLALQSNFKLNLSLTDFGLAFNEPISLEITDKEGALVWANEVTNNSLAQGRIESSELPKGSYQLSLKGAHIQTTELSFESNEASTLELEVALKGKYDNTSDIIQQWGYPMLTFDFDRYTTTVDQEMIQMLADRLSIAKSITIEGHSDQRGKAKYNQKLSFKRAEYIRDQLVEAGLPAESIKVIGLGERQLLVNCRLSICRNIEEQKNRRVEIKAQF